MSNFSAIASAKQMQEMDRECMKSQNISSIELMQNAAFAFYSSLVQDSLFINVSQVLIICGKGNNGGDGYCLALYLEKMGLEVFIYSLEDKKQKSPDCEHYFSICKQNQNILFISSLEEFSLVSSKCDMLIDAVYGTQFRDSFNAEVEDIFKIISEIKTKKVAIDIPSGLHADNATYCKYAFKADLTITFEYYKYALLAYPAAEYAGRVKVVSIGFSKEIKNNKTNGFYIIADCLESVREVNTHKGNYGKLLLACGSESMLGAGYFAAMGALRFGIGLLYFSCQQELMPLMQLKLNEPVFLPYDIKCEHTFKTVFSDFSKYSALVHGCGFGTNPEAQEITHFLIKNSTIPLVLDADAITTISKDINILAQSKALLILTPHEAEMARLINKDINYVKENRLEIARTFAKKHQCYLILKGARTIIATPDEEIYINSTANAGLAKGGSGDILAGMLGAALSQCKASDFSPSYIKKALCSAVYNHGLAGDRCAEQLGQRAMLPTDILNFIR